MSISKVRSLCIDMITKLNDDRSYVLAVMGCLQTDDEVQRIIDFMKSDDSITANDIILEAVYIDQERDFSEELKEALERYLKRFGEYYPLAVSGTKSDDEIVKDIDRCLASDTKEKVYEYGKHSQY